MDQPNSEPWVMVYQARESWQAALVKGWLEDAGIPAMQMNPQTDWDVWGEAPAPVSSGVRVPASYEGAARQLLGQMLPKA